MLGHRGITQLQDGHERADPLLSFQQLTQNHQAMTIGQRLQKVPDDRGVSTYSVHERLLCAGTDIGIPDQKHSCILPQSGPTALIGRKRVAGPQV